MAKQEESYMDFKKRVLKKTKIKNILITFKDGNHYMYTAEEFLNTLKDWLVQGMMMADHREVIEDYFAGSDS